MLRTFMFVFFVQVGQVGWSIILYLLDWVVGVWGGGNEGKICQ